MARYKVIAMRDRVADLYGQPSCVNNLGSAIRSFGDEVKRADENNQLYKHPDDFDLFLLGEYDDELGVFVNEEPRPKQIALGKDYV